MAIKYLGKLRPIDFQDWRSYVQMVNVPELKDCQRCPFCHYFTFGRTYDEYIECQEKRKCGNESLIFMPLLNISANRDNILDDFTLTPVTKQLTIDNQKRYLQLLSSDIQGYECNQLCQYYPARIAAEQSIAECANSNACGRNGSFWDLLTPSYPYLAEYPDIKSDIIDETTFVTLGGRVIRGVELDSIYVDVNHYPKAVLSDESSWRIVNMIPESAMAGQIIRARQDSEPRLWEWISNAALTEDGKNTLIITKDDQPIAQMMKDYGYPQELFYKPLRNLSLIRVSSSGSSWFVNDDDYFELVSVGIYRLAIIKGYLNGYSYIIKFGTTGDVYLAAKYPNDPPSKWVKATLPNLVTTNYHVVTLTAYNEQMTQWLMTIGVRQSLFFFK